MPGGQPMERPAANEDNSIEALRGRNDPSSFGNDAERVIREQAAQQPRERDYRANPRPPAAPPLPAKVR
jgi:hypothetical protein